MRNKELKNCPFCGGEAHISWDLATKCAEAICESCGARSAPCLYGRCKIPVGGRRCRGYEETREEVVRLWNQRKKSPR